jgi:hypothetical protein
MKKKVFKEAAKKLKQLLSSPIITIRMNEDFL